MNKNYLLIVVLTMLLSGCGTIGRAVGLERHGTVNIKFDREAELCEMSVEFGGNRYDQVFIDEDDSRYSVSELHMGIDSRAFEPKEGLGYPKRILEYMQTRKQSPQEPPIYVYRITASCHHERADPTQYRGRDEEVQNISIGIGLPSKSLKTDGRSIVAGRTPLELIEKGFTVTIPVDKQELASSSIPDFDENLTHNGGSLIQVRSSIAGIVKHNFTCDGGFINILGGTLTVHPNTSVFEEPELDKRNPLYRYRVMADRWEFTGTVEGYVC